MGSEGRAGPGWALVSQALISEECREDSAGGADPVPALEAGAD